LFAAHPTARPYAGNRDRRKAVQGRPPQHWACRSSCSRPRSPTATRAERSATVAACSRPRSAGASRRV
jgi:hypothetical protein